MIIQITTHCTHTNTLIILDLNLILKKNCQHSIGKYRLKKRSFLEFSETKHLNQCIVEVEI